MFQSTLLLVLLSSANAFPATPSASSTARDFCLNEQNVNGKYKVDPSKGALDKGWMSLGCTIKEVVDTDQSYTPQQKWKAADADSALATSEVCASLVQGNSQKSYSSAISNFLHGPTPFNCEDLDPDAGGSGTSCDPATFLQCEEAGHAAGFMILNSLMVVHKTNQGIIGAMEHAKGDIIGRVGNFADIFSPKIDKLKELKLVLDIVLIVFNVVASLMWNLVAKAIVPVGGRNLLDAGKDFTNSMMTSSFTLTKDIAKDKTDVLGTQNDLSDMATNLINDWEDMMSASNEAIFGGHVNASKLALMIQGGQVLGKKGDYTDALNQPPDQKTVSNNMEQALWAAMMPWAWQRSTNGAWPVVISPTHPDASKGCDGWDAETEAYMSKADGLTAFVCVDNAPYWLAGLPDPGAIENCKIEDGDSNTCSQTKTLPLLPGADQLLVGHSPWGGVTMTDLVTGAVRTWKANGMNNGAQSSLNYTDAAVLEDFSTQGIRSAGFTNFPVCDGKTAFANWGIPHKDMDNYPCQPLTGDLAHCDEQGWGGCAG